MPKYLLSSVVLVIVLWLGVFVFSFGVLRIPDFDQYSLDATVAIQGNEKVSQLITSEHAALSSIGISVKNINLQNKKDLILTLSEGTTMLRTVAINGVYVPDGKFLRFDFEPIPDSLHKTYMIEFSSPTSTLEDAMEIYLTKQSFTQAGNLVVGGLPYPEYKAISFVSFHKPTSRIATFNQIISNFQQRLFSDPLFIGLFVGIIIILIGFGLSKKANKLFDNII